MSQIIILSVSFNCNRQVSGLLFSYKEFSYIHKFCFISLVSFISLQPKESYPGSIYIYDMDQLAFASATDKKGILFFFQCLN